MVVAEAFCLQYYRIVTEILQMGGPAFVKILLYLWKYPYFMRCQDLF